MNLMVSICERDHLFCLLSSSKMEFCCNNCILLHFVFCSIPFLVFKIQITVVQKSTKKCFCNKPHSCKSLGLYLEFYGMLWPWNFLKYVSITQEVDWEVDNYLFLLVSLFPLYKYYIEKKCESKVHMETCDTIAT